MTLQTFWPMLKKEFYEQYRTYRVLIAVIILLLLGLSAPIVTKLTQDLLSNLGGGIKIILPPQTATDALNSYLKNMVQLPALMIILLAMGCVADERSHGTAVMVLTKPVPRHVFVLAKFLAYALLLFAGTVLAAAGADGVCKCAFPQCYRCGRSGVRCLSRVEHFACTECYDCSGTPIGALWFGDGYTIAGWYCIGGGYSVAAWLWDWVHGCGGGGCLSGVSAAGNIACLLRLMLC